MTRGGHRSQIPLIDVFIFFFVRRWNLQPTPSGIFIHTMLTVCLLHTQRCGGDWPLNTKEIHCSKRATIQLLVRYLLLYVGRNKRSTARAQQKASGRLLVCVLHQTLRIRIHEGGMKAWCDVVGSLLTARWQRTPEPSATSSSPYKLEVVHKKVWRCDGKNYATCASMTANIWEGISFEGCTDLNVLTNPDCY